MKPSVKTLGEILYAPGQYVIPVFQRNYRWEMPQWAKYMGQSSGDSEAPRSAATTSWGSSFSYPVSRNRANTQRFISSTASSG